MPDDQIVCLCEGCKRGLELVHNGNERAALFTLRTAKERGELNRETIELLAWKMEFGNGMTTNQKAGSSNLSGRAIKSISYLVFGCGTVRSVP